MNEQAIYHIPESNYCFAVNLDTVKIRLRMDKNDKPKIVRIIYGGKYDFAVKKYAQDMSPRYTDRLYTYYEALIKLTDLRLTYVFYIEGDGKSGYFSEDGLTKDYNFELNYFNCFQYAYINPCDTHTPISWLDTAVFYQIFVDRFCLGDRNKDLSYINLNWGDLPTPQSFAGGDLKGIEQKLDYIKDLGVNAVYLTPVFKSPSNHKYDTIDYYTVDSHFGSNEDLKRLVEKAHKMGIKVMLDAVFNHVSDRFKYFLDLKKNGVKSEYYDWFIVSSDNPLTYECFASCKYMPKLNTSNKKVQDYLIDVACYWIKTCDIDGWRLDVSDEVSHQFWQRLRLAVKEVKSDCVLIGENWHDAYPYLRGDQFDSIMNYAFTKACLDFYAFENFDEYKLSDKLNQIITRNSDSVNMMMLNLLDSHDTHRFLTRVKSEQKLLSALCLNFFFVGVPCIYYGTENAMQGNYDPDSRRTFDWGMQKTSTKQKALIKLLAGLKNKGELCGADIRIYVKDGLLFIDRNNLRLIINGATKKPFSEKPLYSEGFDGREIAPFGFIIQKKGDLS